MDSKWKPQMLAPLHRVKSLRDNTEIPTRFLDEYSKLRTLLSHIETVPQE